MTKVYLRDWRDHKGMSQRDIANRVDATKGAISRLETGSRRLTTDWLDRLSKALGVDTLDLYRPPSGTPAPRRVRRATAGGLRLPPPVNQNMGAGCPTVFALRPSRDTLQITEIQGDYMAPTLKSGDAVLVDKTKTAPVPPGLFLMRELGEVVVRRVRVSATTRMATVSVDNSHYEIYEVEAEKLDIIGRVIAQISQI